MTPTPVVLLSALIARARCCADAAYFERHGNKAAAKQAAELAYAVHLVIHERYLS